jgi:hypothetical protein
MTLGNGKPLLFGELGNFEISFCDAFQPFQIQNAPENQVPLPPDKFPNFEISHLNLHSKRQVPRVSKTRNYVPLGR